MQQDIVSQHIISESDNIRNALILLDKLSTDAILFVVDENNHLSGSLTDGDIRRGFIKGLGFNDTLVSYMQQDPVYLKENEYSLEDLESVRKFKIIPILNVNNEIVDIINFRLKRTILPIDVVIMAGGKGQRLMPLTANTPKPLLKIGDKPIIEYNIDQLIKVGVKGITLSVNYLSDQIIHYFGNGEDKGITIDYIIEDKPLGTIGSILLKQSFQHEDVLVMNSDLLTNIDFADFYKTFKETDADIAVAAVSYKVKVPYGVLETNNENIVVSLKEKPSYTYFSNAGIYLIKKEILSMIPPDSFFDITDLMGRVIDMKNKLVTYPLNCYWLDIGKHEDFKKAQEDIKHIKM
jgi:dTDP-glucose pyrophosphorylase